MFRHEDLGAHCEQRGHIVDRGSSEDPERPVKIASPGPSLGRLFDDVGVVPVDALRLLEVRFGLCRPPEPPSNVGAYDVGWRKDWMTAPDGVDDPCQLRLGFQQLPADSGRVISFGRVEQSLSVEKPDYKSWAGFGEKLCRQAEDPLRLSLVARDLREGRPVVDACSDERWRAWHSRGRTVSHMSLGGPC